MRTLLLVVVASLVSVTVYAQEPPAAGALLSEATNTQEATRARLGVLGDAFACPDARIVSYRRSDAEPEIVDQWYVASQLWADALLLQTPDQDTSDTRCYVDKGFVFLDRLWDYTSAGYFPRSNPVGTSVQPGPRYTDDNLIAGLALLETARTTTDPAAIRRYIHAAQREADFLLSSSLWDDTFGGGFWWNTGRGDSEEGKPAQTNALAALFFAWLYDATGDSSYRDWSLKTLLWLDTILWDPSRQLYRWSVAFQDIQHRTGAVIHQRYFNYDQGIAIEGQLAAAQLDGNADRATRAEAIGHATQTAFWSSQLGGYNLEAGVDQVFTSYSAWTSLGHLALYTADADPSWLEMATGNLSGLTDRLREPDNGYAYRVYRCVDRVAKGCESGQVSTVVDHARDTSAQSWMQHLQTAMALERSATATP